MIECTKDVYFLMCSILLVIFFLFSRLRKSGSKQIIPLRVLVLASCRCFLFSWRLILDAFRWTWPSVCSSSKCHVDAYISMFSQSVLFSERCVCSGYGHGWDSSYGDLSPQLRDSSRERKRRPWRASSSPWIRARRHASDALSHRAFHTVLFFLLAAPYKNLT